MPIARKSTRVVTHLERLPIIMSHDPLITCSCEFTRQIKNIPPLAQWLWPPNLTKCLPTVRGSLQ